VCNDDQGAFALSAGPGIEGVWKSIPADIAESNCTMQFLTKNEVAQRTSTTQTQQQQQQQQPQVEQATELERANSQSAAALDVASMQSLLKRWNDSNHECLLFSNKNHVVHFLSLDPKQLRETMHPGLLRLMELNGINVGSDMNILDTKHVEILGALTDVHRSASEASKLLGGGYCMTGDSLMKMLAIYVRIRCGIPVILMGECGCGKTQLIRYLCTFDSSCPAFVFVFCFFFV
jgi:transcriptional regulator of acetoin/glycerol metabolism